jgi:hypothetical protein
MTPRRPPFTLYPSKTQQWKFLAASVGLMLLGYPQVERGNLINGWFTYGFGALLSLFAIVQLLPGSNSLTVEEHGFRIVALFREQRFRWEEVDSFGTYEFKIRSKRRVLVGFNFAPGARPITKLMRKSRKTLGYEAGVPTVDGFTPAELVELLETYRLQHTKPAD